MAAMCWLPPGLSSNIMREAAESLAKRMLSRARPLNSHAVKPGLSRASGLAM